MTQCSTCLLHYCPYIVTDHKSYSPPIKGCLCTPYPPDVIDLAPNQSVFCRWAYPCACPHCQDGGNEITEEPNEDNTISVSEFEEAFGMDLLVSSAP